MNSASPHDNDVSTWSAVDAYFGDQIVGEDESLRAARASGQRTTQPDIEVTPQQGAFLGLLTQISGAKRILEFGTLAGYSAMWMARAMPASGRLVTLELEDHNAAVARKNFERAGLADRVDVLVGPAVGSARRLIDQAVDPFDLVFIDADKPSNPEYLAAALELTAPGAVIVIDNVVRGGAVIDADSTDPRVKGVRQVVEDIAANPALDATALQTVGSKGWDGFIVVRRG